MIINTIIIADNKIMQLIVQHCGICKLQIDCSYYLPACNKKVYKKKSYTEWKCQQQCCTTSCTILLPVNCKLKFHSILLSNIHTCSFSGGCSLESDFILGRIFKQGSFVSFDLLMDLLRVERRLANRALTFRKFWNTK